MPEVGFVSRREETHDQWLARMAGEALAITRSELYLQLRYLDGALAALTPVPDEACRRIATDGLSLYFAPQEILKLCRENDRFLCRLMLHSVLHCIFRHLWLGRGRDPELWGLACDIAVEHVIDHLNKPALTRPLTYTRLRAYEAVAREEQLVAAAPAYRWLCRQTPGVQRQLYREFHTDDHRLWPKDDQQDSPAAMQAQSTWQKLGKRMQTELETRSKEAGDGQENLQAQVSAAVRSRRSYRDFLRKFCTLREEPRLDMDNFDLNFYSYGLRVYGNMPLIEPPESREAFKVAELALVVDTSYSTSGELVRAFLNETYALLKQRENFFQHMHLRILQADDKVQQDIKVTTEAELQQAMAHFRLRGGGGTDFRPAFRYVDKLREDGQLQNLKGLLYFTDGLGKYPQKRPAYDTAFLFLGEQFDDSAVPPWAMKLILDEAEFIPPRPETTAPFDPNAEDDDFDALRDLNNT